MIPNEVYFVKHHLLSCVGPQKSPIEYCKGKFKIKMRWQSIEMVLCTISVLSSPSTWFYKYVYIYSRLTAQNKHRWQDMLLKSSMR